MLDTNIRVEALDQAALELETFREQIAFCRYLIEKNPTPEREATLGKALEAVDLEALKSNDWARWRESAKAAVDILMPFNDEAKSFEVNLVAHSHIDMNWLWPWTETVEVCRRDFSTMDKLMERFPDFHFSQSQVAVYKAMQDYHPEVFERMKARIEQGNWEVTAATWVEGDLNTAIGETLIRQILHSKRYLRADIRRRAEDLLGTGHLRPPRDPASDSEEERHRILLLLPRRQRPPHILVGSPRRLSHPGLQRLLRLRWHSLR